MALHGPNGTVNIFAMFDEGASVSLLDEKTAKRIGLKGVQNPLKLQWYGDQVHTEPSSCVSLEVSARNDPQKYCLKNVRTVRSLNLPKQSFNKINFAHVDVLPLEAYDEVQPVLLIGLDHIHLGATSTLVQGATSEPIAAKTKLGWVAYGPASSSRINLSHILHLRPVENTDQLDTVVAEYF